MTSMQTPSLESWDIRHHDDVEWLAWGSEGNARVKILGQADGYTVAVIQAAAGSKTLPPQHAYAGIFYRIDGSIRNQGQHMGTGDGYAAATGSVHTDFEVQSPSTDLSIFGL